MQLIRQVDDCTNNVVVSINS